MNTQPAQQPQTNPQYVVDDPLAPLRLPPPVQIGEFWRRYDRLADIHDRKLTSNLNGNLDVLLIFAALFSGINTTFISITMPNLSLNPSDETNNLLRLLVMRADNNTLTPAASVLPFSPDSNSVIVNCLLYASLSCSLLAAVGAMMAKEWLQSFDRTGQTGPVEEQALLRQRKFNGVQQWHLEAVIKFLPNLLLLSVIFFFVGVCLFLFPINTVVAGIVIAFSGIGLVFFGVVIVSGAVSSMCPYQSAASSGVRRVFRVLAGLGRPIWRSLILPVRRVAWEHLSKCLNTVRLRAHLSPDRASSVFDITPRRTSQFLEDELRGGVGLSTLADSHCEQTLTVQAARWLLGTTSNLADQISAIQFVCSLDRFTCADIFADHDSWTRLLDLTLAQCPKEGDKWQNIKEESLRASNRFGKAFLEALEPMSNQWLPRDSEDDQRFLHLVANYAVLKKCINVNQFHWLKAVYLMESPSPLASPLLIWAELAWQIGYMTRCPWDRPTLEIPPEQLDDKELLARCLTLAMHRCMDSLATLQRDPTLELHFAQGYIVCLQRARELCPQYPDPEIDLRHPLIDLIWTYIDDLTRSDSVEIQSVRLSAEALLTFGTLFSPQPRRYAATGRSFHELIAPVALIDATVDALLADLTCLLQSQDELWRLRAPTFKACIVRILLWIWRSYVGENTKDWERPGIVMSSCRLWAPLERQVAISTNGSFGVEEQPLTPDDLKEVKNFTYSVQFHTLAKDGLGGEGFKGIPRSTFIVHGADVGINRLNAHFDRHADWRYHLYDLREHPVRCPRSVDREEGML